jgi:hypothetical protein
MKTTPLAVFLYNRPDHARRMLNSLAGCDRLDECDVYLYCDSPSSVDHAHQVKAVRDLAQEWGRLHGARIIERTENLGLASSVVGGVTDLCAKYGRVIVVEDDLVLHPAFIHFMLSALDRYQDDDLVAQVSGFMFPVKQATSPDVFFLPYISSWGWATWQRAWGLFDWNPDVSLLKDPYIKNRFNHNGVTDHAQMLEDRLSGKNQSWAVLFYWAIFKKEKLVLFPRVSLVENIGFDGSGVHYSSRTSMSSKIIFWHEKINSFKRNLTAPKWSKSSNFTWPTVTEVDEQAYFKIYHYRSRRNTTIKNRILDILNPLK